MNKIKIEIEFKKHVLDWIKTEALKNNMRIEEYISLVQESSYIQLTKNPNFTTDVLLKKNVNIERY